MATILGTCLTTSYAPAPGYDGSSFFVTHGTDWQIKSDEGLSDSPPISNPRHHVVHVKIIHLPGGRTILCL